MKTPTLAERVDAALKGIGASGKVGYNTRHLKDALKRCTWEEEKGVFPPIFIMALREAVEAGMSCEQITANLILMAGVHRMRHHEPERICCVARKLVEVMSNDLGQ